VKASLIATGTSRVRKILPLPRGSRKIGLLRSGGLWFCGFAADVWAWFYLSADEGVGDRAAEEHLAFFVEVGAVDGSLVIFGALVSMADGIELVGLFLGHAFEQKQLSDKSLLSDKWIVRSHPPSQFMRTNRVLDE
jgi:hypothetical protein